MQYNETQSSGSSWRLSTALLGIGLGAISWYLLRTRKSILESAVQPEERGGETARPVPAQPERTKPEWMDGDENSAEDVVLSTAEEEGIPDESLVDRVRAQIEAAVSHPSSIVIAIEHGNVIVTGPIFPHEVNNLLSKIKEVEGVKEVDNRLDVHPAADVPGLQ